jgi:hypothetical protein
MELFILVLSEAFPSQCMPIELNDFVRCGGARKVRGRWTRQALRICAFQFVRKRRLWIDQFHSGTARNVFEVRLLAGRKGVQKRFAGAGDDEVGFVVGQSFGEAGDVRRQTSLVTVVRLCGGKLATFNECRILPNRQGRLTAVLWL